ncbi:hypothetical protein [Actinoplanes siamensis]|uniref:hypothetical protein n=1 Tax=Actinoplanes siamensis TaxID=1223317 RepID=UPI0019414075|nr:hypothetical protein [Actinoplanes siamensis]
MAVGAAVRSARLTGRWVVGVDGRGGEWWARLARGDSATVVGAAGWPGAMARRWWA